MKLTKTLKILATIGLAGGFLTACIPSVNPFYTAKDIRFDPQLLGEWQKTDEAQERWKFERAGDQGYKVSITEKDDKQGTMDGCLFQLKDELFLDLTPNDVKFGEKQAELVAAAVFPGHLLARVSRVGTELKLALCDYEWLEKFLKAHPRALAHHREGDRILLTASTRDLQRFVLQHLSEGELFSTSTKYLQR